MTRNTPTERICRHCAGTGSVTVNNTNPFGYGPDPQCDEDVSCGECSGDGWIRTAPVDPIALLRQARQHARASWGAMRYGEIRQTVVSPVVLPP